MQKLVFTFVLLVGVVVGAVFVYLGDFKAALSWLCGVYLLHRCLLYRRADIVKLLIAFLFALFITSYHDYTYNSANIFIGQINVFPLLAWTAGLVFLRECYERVGMRNKILYVSVAYLCVLFALEFLGYYFLQIQIAAPYPSLLGTGIIHGPPIIHVFYVVAGPLYLLVTDYLRVK